MILKPFGKLCISMVMIECLHSVHNGKSFTMMIVEEYQSHSWSKMVDFRGAHVYYCSHSNYLSCTLSMYVVDIHFDLVGTLL